MTCLPPMQDTPTPQKRDPFAHRWVGLYPPLKMTKPKISQETRIDSQSMRTYSSGKKGGQLDNS